MNYIDNIEQSDLYLRRIKQAKDVRAVAKVSFAKFASSLPVNTNIFTYEGPDDKCVFYHWINRIKKELKYEPYIAKNKRAVLQLFDALKIDQTGLGDTVYFFVDRDFDCLQGRAADKRIFLTDAYSIENYLVCKELLEDLLKVDFHCDGYLKIRSEIIAIFDNLYTQFLEITEDINFRIFVARKFNIHQIEDIPSSINSLIDVGLDSVKSLDFNPQEFVKLEREPTSEEMDACMAEFNSIDPKTNYRGKFALMFFLKWLVRLRGDRISNSPVLFKTIPHSEFSVSGDFSLRSLASKAPVPEELYSFLENFHAT